MAKKIRLSQTKKDFIKDFYDVLDKKDVKLLNKNELAYYNTIKASRASTKARDIKEDTIKVDGKVYRGQVVEIVKGAAKNIGVSANKFIKENKQEVVNFINTSQVRLQRSPDAIIDQIHDSRKTKYYIDDGNGRTKVTKKEAMKLVSQFQNFVKTNTDIVDIRVFFKKTVKGEIIIEMPLPEEWESVEGDEESIDDLLELNDVFYVRSRKK